MDITLSSFSDRLLISIPFSSFFKVLSHSSICNINFCLLLYLTLCVCFCVLSRPATSPGPEGGALWRRHPVRVRNTIPSGHQNQGCPMWWAECALLL